MTKHALARSLARWLKAAPPTGGEHCIQVRPRFRIPGAGAADLLTVRHRPSPAGDQFSVALWSIDPGGIGDAAVDAMTRRLHAFEAWYSELREHAETQGFRPVHRIRVCGNLVGRSVRRSPLVDLLSAWGSAVCFWTWRGSGSRFDVSPWYGRGPSLRSARTQLKGLLHDLTWRDAADGDVEAAEKLPAASD